MLFVNPPCPAATASNLLFNLAQLCPILAPRQTSHHLALLPLDNDGVPCSGWSLSGLCSHPGICMICPPHLVRLVWLGCHLCCMSILSGLTIRNSAICFFQCPGITKKAEHAPSKIKQCHVLSISALRVPCTQKLVGRICSPYPTVSVIWLQIQCWGADEAQR